MHIDDKYNGPTMVPEEGQNIISEVEYNKIVPIIKIFNGDSRFTKI